MFCGRIAISWAATWAMTFCVVSLSAVRAQTLGWYAASDTHLGHDPISKNGTHSTSYEKNVWAIDEMNALPGHETWPPSLGGGLVILPEGVTISGDLIDSGIGSSDVVNGCQQWENFTALYGMNGTDGMLRYKTYEGRGNHDGGNSTLPDPRGCSGHPSKWIIERNQVRAADPAFRIDGVSSPTGLHYSWTWNVSSTCAVHFVHLNLFPGHQCGSAMNPGGEGSPGFPCKDGDLAWAEESLGFLEADLPIHAGPGVMVITIQHYGFDGFSNGWYNEDQRVELMETLLKYNTLAVLVGHTHSAEMYSYNGTAQGVWDSNRTGFIDVINAPATQKEDGTGDALPSEFMVLEAAMDSTEASTGTFRVAQRVGHGWGTIMGRKRFTCS